MRLRLNKIKLENFKCFPRKEVDFGGNNAVVRGENGEGKTTIADAYSWLHTDNDTSGRKAFGMRPLGKDNKPIRGIVVAVEDELFTNGVAHTFRKEQHERIVKDNIVGFTNLYWIDEVPKSKTEYNDYHHDNIMPEDKFKMLTDLALFNDDRKMLWPKRREVLLDVAGKVSVPGGYEKLIEKLNGRKLDDYEKVLKDRKSKYKEERDEIPIILNEKHRDIAEIGPIGSVEEQETARDDCKNKITGLEAERSTLRNSEDERAGHVEHINRLTAKRGHRENVLKNQTGPAEILHDERMSLLNAQAEKCQKLIELQGLIRGTESALVASKNTIEASLLTLKMVKDERDAAMDTTGVSLYEKSIEHVNGCDLAEEDLREEAAAYIADKDIKQKAVLYIITNRGNQIREAIEVCKAEQEQTQTKINATAEKETAMEANIAQSAEAMAKRIAEIDEAIKNKPEVDPHDDNEWMELTREIIKTQAKLGDPLTEQLEAIENEIKFANDLLVKLNECLAQADTIKKAKARITELEARQKKLGQIITALDGELAEINQFHADQNTLIEEAVNGMFDHVTYKLFDFYLNEGYKPCCIAILDGVPYPDMSAGQKTYCGIDVISTLSNYYGVEVPLFVDHTESMTLPIEAKSQVIKLYAEKGVKELQVEVEPEEAKAVA